MQKSFSTGHPTDKHIPALKKLWVDVFGDAPKVVDNFFDKTAKPENVFCVFCDNEPVSVLYAIDSTIFLNGAEYKSYYVYAVCTHSDYRGNNLSAEVFSLLEKAAKQRGVSYLFLVPAEKSLFGMYERLGFSIGFKRRRQVVERKTYCHYEGDIQELSFSEYKKQRLMYCSMPQAVLDEGGFNSFYKPVGGNMRCFAVGAEGFVVYEKENNNVSVLEMIGDERALLSAVFGLTDVDELCVYGSAIAAAQPYGMLKSLDGSPTFDNGFFGVSYGG